MLLSKAKRLGCGGTWLLTKMDAHQPPGNLSWRPMHLFSDHRVTEYKIIYAAVCIYTHLMLMSFIKIWSIYNILFPYGYATISFPWSHLFMFNEIIQNLKKADKSPLLSFNSCLFCAWMCKLKCIVILFFFTLTAWMLRWTWTWAARPSLKIFCRARYSSPSLAFIFSCYHWSASKSLS